MDELSNFEEAHTLYRDGHYDKAKAHYLDLLKKQPRNAELLHALGTLSAKLKNFKDAIHYLKQAVLVSPNDPVLQLHLANALKLQGSLTDAKALLVTTVNEHPNYAPAYNNLGTTYYELGETDAAIRYYRLAIQKKSDYTDAYYNLGLTLVKAKCFNEAVEAYQTLLKLQPDHFAARFQLASVYMQIDFLEEAIKEFCIIEKTHVHHLETQINLATCFLKKSAWPQAKLHYLKALELSADDIQILFNLGVVSMHQGMVDSAIQYYQRVVRLNADYFPAYNNLGVAFLQKQQHEFALPYFKEALRLQPTDEALKHIVEVLSNQKELTTTPKEYVISLFDSYAEYYDAHLLQGLNYQVPELLFEAAEKVLPVSAVILDLGCGTGLCGALFKPYAKKLIGIDVSEKMLAIAKEKNQYDELIQDDFLVYLSRRAQQFDVIVAGDVLAYVGDLMEMFKHIQHALMPKGYFVFNTEISEDKDFQMNAPGRFAYSKEYIEKLSEKNHLRVRHYEKAPMRRHQHNACLGHIFVLQLV